MTNTPNTSIRLFYFLIVTHVFILFQGAKVTDSPEYKAIEAELAATKDSLVQLRKTLHNMEKRMEEQQKQSKDLKDEVSCLLYYTPHTTIRRIVTL